MFRPLSIKPVLNGFIVDCGCQSIAYTSVDELLIDLGKYLRDPEETEKEIIKNKGINSKHTLRQDNSLYYNWADMALSAMRWQREAVDPQPTPTPGPDQAQGSPEPG